MANTDFTKQTVTDPAFSDVLWSKPENKQARGKLLIIGGNEQGLSAPMDAFNAATNAGIGEARVLLPNALKKVTGNVLEFGSYAPSTPSGSFNQLALAEFIDSSVWADATLFAGSLGRNSETAIVLEKYLQKHKGPVIISQDAVDYVIAATHVLTKRGTTILVMSLAQLQKYAKNIKLPQAITFQMDLLQLTAVVQDLSSTRGVSFVVKHLKNIIVAHDGNVSVTQLTDDIDVWRVKTAACVSVWLIQQPEKPFEAISTAVWEYIQKKD
jgi:NAD(P)H-hydrate repair Nnr-like enzyme with NAD(P)H-hydrate dehydratase domain